ncbi:unnamed protein product [Boreogadus saida]
MSICVCTTTNQVAQEGQSEATVELDGRKPFPIVHGKTSEDTFLEGSRKDVQSVSWHATPWSSTSRLLPSPKLEA